jgi:hypothetical protein
MGEESNLYMTSAVISLLAFLVALHYCLTRDPKSEYGIYPILILGLLSLAKSIETYEKYTYKLSSNR